MAADDISRDNGQPSAVGNRRKWARYQTDPSDIVVFVGRRKRKGVVVDESIGGLGIMMADVRKLVVDQEVRAQYRGIDVSATVKSIREEEDGLYHVGIGWLDRAMEFAPASPPPRKESTQFVCHQGVWLACEVIDMAADGIVTIALWDGAYFEVPGNRVVVKTVQERTAELVELHEDIRLLAGLYQLGDPGSMEATRNAVLDFEFALDWCA
jgi:hypothetical protein